MSSPFRLAPPHTLQPTAVLLEKQLNEYNVKEEINLDFSKYNKRRDKIALEILTSEASYLRDLEVGVALYKNPLTAAVKCGELGIPQKSIDQIFGIVCQLLCVNKQLFEGLKELFFSWSDTQKIGGQIISLTPFLKMYRQYTESYEDAVAALKDAEKRDVNFSLFIQELSKHPVAQSRNLHSFLILPVQRIPRYVLLLQDLIKNTPEDHEDFSDLTKALSDMKVVASYIDVAIVAAENRKKMLSLQEIFPNSPITIIQAHRRFIYEGWLNKQNRRGEQKRKKFFVLSDIIIYGKEDVTAQILTGTLKFSGYLELSTITISDVEDVEVTPDSQVTLYRPPHAIFIETPRKSFFVYADSKQDKKKWMEIIETAKKSNSDNLQLSAEQLQQQQAAVWVPDYVMKACPLCYQPFGFFVRRHHCRKCGTLVCDDCSKQKANVFADGNLVRVCNRCFTAAAAAAAAVGF